MAGRNLITMSRPMEPFLTLNREIDRMFDDFFEDWTGRLPTTFRHDWGEWQYTPRVDVMDRGREYELRAELPGFTKEDIHVDVAGDSVSLRGQRKEEKREGGEGQGYVCRESAMGAFERTVVLPDEVRAEDVKAKLRDGILTLTLPKAHMEERRAIEVTEE